MTRKLVRVKDQGKLLGVCRGVADYFETDVTLVRLVFVGVAIFSAILPMVIFYLVAAALIPTQADADAQD